MFLKIKKIMNFSKETNKLSILEEKPKKLGDLRWFGS